MKPRMFFLVYIPASLSCLLVITVGVVSIAVLPTIWRDIAGAWPAKIITTLISLLYLYSTSWCAFHMWKLAIKDANHA